MKSLSLKVLKTKMPYSWSLATSAVKIEDSTVKRNPPTCRVAKEKTILPRSKVLVKVRTDQAGKFMVAAIHDM